MKRTLQGVACACALTLLPAATHAQNIAAAPVYTTLDLSAGFRPDPQQVNLSAGGSTRISQGGCSAYIYSGAPDVDLNYRSGSYELTIYAESSADVTLLVNTPDGNWHCNDDSNGTNPSLTFRSPQSGNYNIWVGTYSDRSGGLPSAVLSVTEGSPRWGASSSSSTSGSSSRSSGSSTAGSGSGAAPNWRAAPTYRTVNLRSGFAPDPDVSNISAGGRDRVAVRGSGSCTGYIHAAAPDVDLNYTSGSFPLNIYAKADHDITLVVNQPDGSWICSDDANGTNPAVRISNPMSGNYNIWIGTFSPSSGSLPGAQLYISELSPRW